MNTVDIELTILVSAILGVILVSVGAGLTWGSCHHAVSAQVVSEQPLPEYGRCMVNVTYTSYDGVQYDASVNSACSGQLQATNQNQSQSQSQSKYIIPGCYNHFKPWDLDTKTPVQTNSFIGGLVTFAIGIAFAVVCIGMIVWLIVLIRTNRGSVQQHQHQHQQKEHDITVAVGLPVQMMSKAEIEI